MKEGSFEGHMSGLDFTQNASIEIKEFQTETAHQELPVKIDYKAIPENVLRSDVIETLISQNEDLMSRLTVALRRAALLDEKVTDARTESQRYKAKYANLTDQVLVLREQAKVLSERLIQGESRSVKDGRSFLELQEHLRIVEIRYAELYTQTQEKQFQNEKKFEALNRQIRRFTKYRVNIRAALQRFKQELALLHSKRTQQEAQHLSLKSNLEETTAYITQQSKEHKTQLSELTDSYERQIKDLQAENQMLVIQNTTLGERAQEMDRLYNEKVRLENELIIAERREEEAQIQNAAEISDLQKSLARFRSDAKELAVELDSKLKELESKNAALEAAEKDKKESLDQVETLQLLWRDQQAQIDKLTNQKDSLQKLNKELSVSINEYRREVRELKEKIDAENLKRIESEKLNDETIKKIKFEMTNKKNNDEPVTTPAEVVREDMITPEIMSKIDKALTHLHVGR